MTRTAPVDFPQIAQRIAKHYSHTMIELRSPKRHKNLTLARHVAMYFMKKMTSRSLMEIAAFWCRKDHTTVLHAVEKIEQLRTTDKKFHLELLSLEQLVQR